MSALDCQSLIERFPTELLERILLLTSARDILRSSSINRAFYDLIRASPSIQYQIDLFGAGLQHNPRTEASLADCCATFEAYRRRWETLDSAGTWDGIVNVSGIQEAIVVSEIYGILLGDSARFFALGSGSLGIPRRREWGFSLEHAEAGAFAFYPQANVMAVIEELAWTCTIRLNTLNDGEPHPNAEIKALSYTFVPGNAGPANHVLEMSITSSRIAVLRGVSNIHLAQIVVWDWTTGQILLELDNRFCKSAKFADDYWLALVIASREPTAPPRLVLINTEQTPVDHSTLTQTTFHFDPREHLGEVTVRLHLDRGGHKPSVEEALFAPFYQDASQRMLAVELISYKAAFVVKAEVLLKLARERGGADLEWEEWNAHTTEIQTRDTKFLWVSGPRVFCIFSTGGPNWGSWMDVHDFSSRELARRMETVTDSESRRLVPVGRPRSVVRHRLPWDALAISFLDGGHDSIVALMVPEDGGKLGLIDVWNF